MSLCPGTMWAGLYLSVKYSLQRVNGWCLVGHIEAWYLANWKSSAACDRAEEKNLCSFQDGASFSVLTFSRSSAPCRTCSKPRVPTLFLPSLAQDLPAGAKLSRPPWERDQSRAPAVTRHRLPIILLLLWFPPSHPWLDFTLCFCLYIPDGMLSGKRKEEAAALAAQC